MQSLTEELERHLEARPARPSPIPPPGTPEWEKWYWPYLKWVDRKDALLSQIQMGRRLKPRR